MKLLTILIAFVSLVLAGGCKKCYKCETNRKMKVCEGSPYYNQIQNDSIVISGIKFGCK
jgi:hypothetical protein